MPETTWEQVRARALSYPHAIEDFPWDTPVIKIDHPPGRMINGNVFGPMFLWLGKPAATFAVKLTSSYDEAVAVGRGTPLAFSGLGQWGWLSIPLAGAKTALLDDWIDESYRNVAPKFLVAELDD